LIAIVLAVLGLTAPAPPLPADPPFGPIDKCLTFPIGCANEELLPSAADGRPNRHSSSAATLSQAGFTKRGRVVGSVLGVRLAKPGPSWR
jgi:hypothetical protein